MTVAQLISKLQKMPQDSIVTVFNDKLYVDGEFEATESKHMTARQFL